MKVINYSESRRDECATFWWHLYEHLPYVHCPDGYQNVNSATHIRPDYFLSRLDEGLSCRNTRRWHGEVRNDTIFLAVDEGELIGILVCSVDWENAKGSILSAYMHRSQQGREVAMDLVDCALRFFTKAGLREAVAAPDPSKSLEAESPIHLALLGAGFAWKDNWELSPVGKDQVYVKAHPSYEVFLGGALEDFRLSPEIDQRIGAFQEAGITIERYTPDQYESICRLDTRKRIHGSPDPDDIDAGTIEGDATFVALHDGYAVGWLWEVITWSDSTGSGTPRIMGGCVPKVIPHYRNRGIGKVLYHLGIEEAVKQGAQYGWTATGVSNPARLIYQSIGYDYWYLAFNLMYKSIIAG